MLFKVDFAFKPQMCDLQCTCSTIAYLQLIRGVDQTDEHAGEVV